MWLAVSVHSIVTIARYWRYCPVIYDDADDIGAKRAIQSPVTEFTSKLKDKMVRRSSSRSLLKRVSSTSILLKRAKKKSQKKIDVPKLINDDPETAIGARDLSPSGDSDSRILIKKRKFSVFKEEDLGIGLDAYIKLEDLKITLDIFYKLSLKSPLEETTIVQLLGN